MLWVEGAGLIEFRRRPFSGFIVFKAAACQNTELLKP